MTRGQFHPTPDMMEAAYKLLCMTKPFNRWKMPDADDVEFHVVRMRYEEQADCSWNGERPVIRIAPDKHTTLAALIATMAHEMLHIHLDKAFPRDRAHHGKRFKQLADSICRYHTFDRGLF